MKQKIKKTIVLVIITAICLFMAGCGPGQPFEIESLWMFLK
jgi:hypothetical protein